MSREDFGDAVGCIWAKIPDKARVTAIMVGLLVLLMAANMAVWAELDPFGTKPVVDGVEMSGGDVFAGAEVTGGVTVTLTAPATEHGVSTLYLYVNGEQQKREQLGPKQESVQLYWPISYGDTWTVTAVDGSNKIVAEMEFGFKEVPREDE